MPEHNSRQIKKGGGLIMQECFSVKFNNLKTFLNDRFREGYKYVSHVTHEDTVVVILKRKEW